MALFDALLNYKKQGRIRSFDMHDDKKATVCLANGHHIVVYMSTGIHGI